MDSITTPTIETSNKDLTETNDECKQCIKDVTDVEEDKEEDKKETPIKRKVMVAEYSSSPDVFLIPKGVELIPDGGDEDTDGSWWIKWGTLHYRWNGEWKELQTILIAEMDTKRPMDANIQDADEYGIDPDDYEEEDDD